MARKPADVVANARFPQGRDEIWKHIRALGRDGKTFTISDVWFECGKEIHRDTVRSYMTSLVIAGILKNTMAAPGKAVHFTMPADLGAEAPRVNRRGEHVTQGLGTEAMWRTMKTMSAFTAAELALMASTSKVQISEGAAKDYLKFMARAKFVRTVEMKPGKPTRFAFARQRDPGPKPPQIQRIKQVFDPNSNTVVWPKAEDQK